jgi:UDP-N-acetylglucosamine 2-epimerase (non-hydrolysing)
MVVAHVVGARPNYMKVASVHRALARYPVVEQRLIHTGQHHDRELNDLFFAQGLLPRPDLDLAVGSAPDGEQTASALVGLERAFTELRPDLAVVVGDVNSTLAGGLAAAKLQVPVCHVEAGLRSFDWTMPEEHNRWITDHLSTLLLTHSESANENLAAEGVAPGRVDFVGNTMIDTLLAYVERARTMVACRRHGLEPRSYVLVTLHRPALVDDPQRLQATVEALDRLARRMPVVFPVHPRTRARFEAFEVRSPRILFTPPLGYVDFLSLEADAAAIITDSGGVQEEATALRVPCFTVRENTERPVTVTHGTNVVLGLDPAAIADVPDRLERPHRELPPLWDGRAGERSATAITRLLGVEAPAAVTVGVWSAR